MKTLDTINTLILLIIIIYHVLKLFLYVVAWLCYFRKTALFKF